jgi:hypothetical protein
LGPRISRKIEPHFAFNAVSARGLEVEFPAKADNPVVRKLRGKENPFPHSPLAPLAERASCSRPENLSNNAEIPDRATL